MKILTIALGAAALGSIPACRLASPTAGGRLQHSIPVTGACRILFSSSSPRLERGDLLLERVRLELTGEDGGITELRLVLFDDLDGDRLPGAGEGRGEARARMAVPSPFIEFGRLRGAGPISRPALWTRLATDRGVVTDSWTLRVRAGR